MWQQPLNPFDNIVLSSIVAAIPIIVLAAMFLSRKVAGYIACIVTLCIALAIATAVYGMPVKLAFMSALYGAMSGILPIGWIVLSAVFLYNISVASGGFAIVRDSIESITADRRLQALLIAFCFGAFLEGSAGFGAPVAITAGMLVGLGFESLYAASICLLANTAPVAFGGIGIAVVTAGQLTNIDPNVVSRMIGHQLPLIALIIPLWLVVLIAGWRGARAIWPAILVAGSTYSITMFLAASYLGPALPDILSAIVSLICLVTLLKFWHPKEVWRFPHDSAASTERAKSAKRAPWPLLVKAWLPFLLLIVFIANWAFAGTQSLLGQFTVKIPFTALNEGVSVAGHALNIKYSFVWLAAAGTGILFAALLTAVLLRMKPREVLRVAKETISELFKPLVTIASIVGFAYVANFSGMSGTLSQALAATGHIFPLVAPLLGWLGVFITGSDTSSNALFSNVQANTAQSLGVNPVLTVGANSSGGVAAKMISPQSVAVAAAATKLTGQEGMLFRKTILHSLGLVSIICVLTYLQAYYLKWMVPESVPLNLIPAHPSFTAANLTMISVSLLAIVILAVIALRAPSLKSSRVVA